MRKRQVKRFDLLADELVRPVQQLLVLRVGFEIPRHCGLLSLEGDDDLVGGAGGGSGAQRLVDVVERDRVADDHRISFPVGDEVFGDFEDFVGIAHRSDDGDFIAHQIDEIHRHGLLVHRDDAKAGTPFGGGQRGIDHRWRACSVKVDVGACSARTQRLALAVRLMELHGEGQALCPGRAGTDIYLDAAGAPAVIDTALAAAKRGARLGVVAVHKQPVPMDFVNLMSNEITIVGSMGYPDEIFEVTKDLIANWEKYAVIVSHTIPFDNVDEALRTASTPGAADKVVVTFK